MIAEYNVICFDANLRVDYAEINGRARDKSTRKISGSYGAIRNILRKVDSTPRNSLRQRSPSPCFNCRLQKLRVTNSQGRVLADCADIADTSAKRRTGLLKHTKLGPGEGLWIAPTEGVHTFGMKFPIDVVFLNKKKKILKIRPSMVRGRIAI